MTSIVGRNENTMTFHYSVSRLEEVVDTLGRSYRYIDGGPGGELQAVRDFSGRHVVRDYDDRGDLIAVAPPTVTGTPNGNDFANSKVTRYTHSSGFTNQRLNHDLLTVTAPNETASGIPTCSHSITKKAPTLSA